ncbi:MAG: hypothetical protein U0802_07900 [Candidatus Binatia bacterium]
MRALRRGHRARSSRPLLGHAVQRAAPAARRRLRPRSGDFGRRAARRRQHRPRQRPLAACEDFDGDDDGSVRVDELLAAVDALLNPTRDADDSLLYNSLRTPTRRWCVSTRRCASAASAPATSPAPSPTAPSTTTAPPTPPR